VNEEDAWRAVDEFMRAHDLRTKPIVDLGCGYGSQVLRAWPFSQYWGFDISNPMLKKHYLLHQPNVRLIEQDLSELADEDLSVPTDPVVFLSVLAFHYLQSPFDVIKKLEKQGSWFCFVVANAAHDSQYSGEDRLVRLSQEGTTFIYFLHELANYVRALNYPRFMIIKECGVIPVNGHLPYHLIAGRW
jgi:trans-aconitate methyltransferase